MNFRNGHGRYGDPAPKAPGPPHSPDIPLDVTTMLTPAFHHLSCCSFVRRAKKVSKLINRPVVSLLGTRVSGTRTEMIA